MDRGFSVAGRFLGADIERVRVGGIETTVATRRQSREMMVADCLAVRANARMLPKLVFSTNGQGISLAASNPDFARTMQAADVVHADGMSVVHASRWLTRKPLPERIATTDFFHDAADAAMEHGLRFYMLGGTRPQNDAACAALARNYPGLQIIGRRNGYFSEEESGAICREIVECGTDVLWVALGKPRQEFWSVRHRQLLRGVGWVKTCGGLLSFLSGESSRAPEWMQRASLEWLYRTMLEPQRLLWRYLVTNPHSMMRMLRDSK